MINPLYLTIFLAIVAISICIRDIVREKGNTKLIIQTVASTLLIIGVLALLYLHGA